MKDIQQLLSETQKPEFESGQHKDQLRRALRHSKYFKQKKSVLPKVVFSLSTGIVAVALVAVALSNSPLDFHNPFAPTKTYLGEIDKIATPVVAPPQEDQTTTHQSTEPEFELGTLRKFKSNDDLASHLATNRLEHDYGYDYESEDMQVMSTSGRYDGLGGGQAINFSVTNTQEELVDEIDSVKNDGQYIYTVTPENTVSIFEAYPAEEMKKLTEIDVLQTTDEEYGSIMGIYLNDNDLTVISTQMFKTFDNIPFSSRCGFLEKCIDNYSEERTLVHIYDVTDRSNPQIKDTIEYSGFYTGSRMIGDYVYILASQSVTEKPILPAITHNGVERVITSDEIYYDLDSRDYSFYFTGIIAINVENGETTEHVSLSEQTNSAYRELYVSNDNIYAFRTNWYDIDQDESTETKTIINKISIDKGTVSYVATGEVKGWTESQFSFDEYQGKLRVATTDGKSWETTDPLRNNVYVLDEEMQIIGSLENLAPEERIYAVRFSGNKGYIVTYKEVDPLFVIDLSNPRKPSVLGELKIPGYSDYLHPYDENHLIGIGMDTTTETREYDDGTTDEVEVQLGIKMALFDVSNPTKPKALYTEYIGDRGTSSEALYEHKAFLFDKQKELMVLPISLSENPEEDSYSNTTFQGAMVYRVNLQSGFEPEGRITHLTPAEISEMRDLGYNPNYNRTVSRAIFMDDYLYTLSSEVIKAHKLWTLEELFSAEL